MVVREIVPLLDLLSTTECKVFETNRGHKIIIHLLELCNCGCYLHQALIIQDKLDGAEGDQFFSMGAGPGLLVAWYLHST